MVLIACCVLSYLGMNYSNVIGFEHAIQSAIKNIKNNKFTIVIIKISKLIP